MADDLRADLESAIEQVESASPSDANVPANTAPDTSQPDQTPDTQTEVESKPATPAADAQVVPESGPKVTVTTVDAPPKSWKPVLHQKWSSLDPEVRAEISRREREVSKSFGENAQIREFHKQFGELIRPYEARINSYGKPLDVIRNLMQTEHHLATAPPVERARFMAKLIRDYGIDIRELDNALAGDGPVDPVKAALEQMLEARLSPLNKFLAQQQSTAQQHEALIREQASSNIQEMSEQVDKYPHFEEVREDMADIIEMNARRQNYLTPEQAYQRAVAMNPEWAAESVKLLQSATQVRQAQQQNSRAQRALAASASVRSMPSSSPTSVDRGENTLRDDIEAAFNQVSGR